LGSKNTPAGNTTTTTNSAPWAAQQPYLQDIFGSAQYLAKNQPPQYYPGTTYAPQTDLQSQGLADMANWGSALTNYNPANYFSNKLLEGTYLNSNPALSGLGNLGASNQGVGGQGYGILNGLQGGQSYLNQQIPYNSLQAYGNQNAGYNNPALGSLSNTAGGNIPGLGYAMGQLPGDISGINNQIEGGTLGYAQGQLPGDISGINSQTESILGTASDPLHSLAGGGATPTGALSQLSQYGGGAFGTGISGAQKQLGNIANAGVPLGYGALQTLGQFAGGPNIAGTGQSAQTLRNFASGAMSGNPETGALAQSVLSSVLPSIQKQFIEGGGLSSPGAAYASSQGATAALAPTLYQQWQQEQANQLAGAQSLESARLQGRGLQQQAAQAQGQQAVSSANARTQAANAAGNLGIGKAGLMSQAAQAGGQLGLSAGQLEQQAAQGLGNLGLSATDQISRNTLGGLGLIGNLGLGQADQISRNTLGGLGLLGNLGLGQAGAQTQAGSTLGSQILQGQGLTQNAAQAALQGAQGNADQELKAALGLQQGQLGGLGLQQQALGSLGNIYGQGMQNMLQGLAVAPQTMQSTLLGPQAEYQAGQQQQGLQQQSINDAVQRWNYWQSLPYQQLNQYLGQVTGNYGGTTSLNQPFYQNTGANIGAGILGGLGAANTIGGSSGIFPGAIASLFGGGGGGLLSWADAIPFII